MSGIFMLLLMGHGHTINYWSGDIMAGWMERSCREPLGFHDSNWSTANYGKIKPLSKMLETDWLEDRTHEGYTVSDATTINSIRLARVPDIDSFHETVSAGGSGDVSSRE